MGQRREYKSLFKNRLRFLFLAIVCTAIPLNAANEFLVEPDDKSSNPPLPAQLVRTQALNINYKIVDVAPEDLARVELWYARGYSGFWQLYDYDEDRVSPIRFVAPEEGIYRFFVVAVDRWGRRSEPFSQSDRTLRTAAIPLEVPGQQVVFIDYTPPQFYLYSPRGEVAEYRDHQITFRWAGFDSHLDTNCVAIFYRPCDSDAWTQVSPPLPATGDFTWNLPQQLDGPVMVKAVITDRAGNWKEELCGPINLTDKVGITKTTQQPSASLTQLAVATKPNAALSEISPLTSSPEATLRNEKTMDAFRRGNIYSQQTNWRQAANAYQEAVDYSPELIEARVNLANVLYRLGEFDRARENFELCLQKQPRRSTALFGLAQTQIALKQFEAAQQSLQKITEQDPKDWQVWLLLGDVYAKSGQDSAAQTAWEQAAEGDLPSITRLANERLNRQP